MIKAARDNASEQPARRLVGARNASAIAALGALAITGGVHAVGEVELSIERLDGAGFRAQGVELKVTPQAGVTRTRLTIAQLRLPALPQTLQNIRIDCANLEMSAEVFACQQALVVVNWPGVGKQSIRANLRYGRRDGALDIALDGVRLADGSGRMQASLREQGWRASVAVTRAPVALLLKLAPQLGLPAPSLSADSGAVTLSASARGSAATLQHVSVDATFVALTINNPGGSLATDKLSFSIKGEARRLAQDWRFSLDVRSQQGQAYAQPIFLDMDAHSLAFSARGALDATRRVTLEKFSFDHESVAQAHGRAMVDLNEEQPLRSLDLQLAALQFPAAWVSYFQPLLLDTNFRSMTTAGSLAGHVLIEEGAPQAVDLRLDDLAFDDGLGNFALSQLQGRWIWRTAQSAGDDDDDRPAGGSDAPASTVRFRDGRMLGLELGGGELRFSTQGRQVRLLEPTRIPLLDGAIDLESFRIRNAGTPKVAFLVDATIQPISAQRLCQAFGWPEFGGQVGGVISKLRMREGVITLGAALQAQVFDGAVRISDLRLEQPFGQWPKLHSTIALENLDLELVTRAFSFGRITGRLSGAINGLQLVNWTPAVFDARLYTPLDDRSRHRISQRAVQNIGNIGGGAGVTAALSSGFLRFFDDFNYHRLGVSCRLANEICHMSGVAPAPNGGYYLVKGQGVPRIDVIGSAQRVDWPRLTQQLIAITESEGPIVK